MLSAKEKRFLHWWDDQRKGGVLIYVLLYTLVWTIIIFLSAILIPGLLSFFFDVNNFLHLDKIPYWVLLLLSLIAGMVLSLYTWQRNEKRRKKLKQMFEQNNSSFFN